MRAVGKFTKGRRQAIWWTAFLVFLIADTAVWGETNPKVSAGGKCLPRLVVAGWDRGFSGGVCPPLIAVSSVTIRFTRSCTLAARLNGAVNAAHFIGRNCLLIANNNCIFICLEV